MTQREKDTQDAKAYRLLQSEQLLAEREEQSRKEKEALILEQARERGRQEYAKRRPSHLGTLSEYVDAVKASLTPEQREAMADKQKQRDEARLRRFAAKRGFKLAKSRQPVHLNNLGGYQLVDRSRNAVVLGSTYDATLKDIQEFLGAPKIDDHLFA